MNLYLEARPGEYERKLRPGEVVRAGDIMVYNHGNSRVLVRRCKYDPGCCDGHVVTSSEDYRRIEKESDMSVPIEVLQARVEKRAVTTVVLSYYPGAHWDCEMRDIQGNRVVAEPDRHWGKLISDAIAQLELKQDQKP